jgi:hypothetical protein
VVNFKILNIKLTLELTLGVTKPKDMCVPNILYPFYWLILIEACPKSNNFGVLYMQATFQALRWDRQPLC